MGAQGSQAGFVTEAEAVVLEHPRWTGKLATFWRKLSADKFALVSAIFLLLVLVSSLGASVFAPYDPAAQNISQRLKPPFTAGHLFGTDALGRDVLSRMMHGARYTLLIGVAATLLAMVLGVFLGLISGYFRGKADSIIMRIVDVQMAFSSMLIIMLVVVMIGPGVNTLIIVFAMATWVLHARVVRGAALYLREMQFVQAAQSIGASNRRIIFVHILPNLLSVIVSISILEAARIMVGEASLSFLGFGVQPPGITWGLMIAEGRDYIERAWWLVTLPGMAIAVTVLAVNLLGIWLRAITDPFQRRLVGGPG